MESESNETSGPNPQRNLHFSPEYTNFGIGKAPEIYLSQFGNTAENNY